MTGEKTKVLMGQEPDSYFLHHIPKLAIFKRNHLFQTIILGIHGSFRGVYIFFSPEPLGENTVEILREKTKKSFRKKNVERILPKKMFLNFRIWRTRKSNHFLSGCFRPTIILVKLKVIIQKEPPFLKCWRADFQGRERKYNQTIGP